MSKETVVSSTSSYEVEKKFTLHNRNIIELQDRLQQLGFVLSKEIIMTDWYYDTDDYQLVQYDNWLRYRSVHNDNNSNDNSNNDTGQWELKRRGKSKPSSKGSSIYEEIIGVNAFAEAALLLRSTDNVNNNNNTNDNQKRTLDYVRYIIPVLPTPYNMLNLTPFALCGVFTASPLLLKEVSSRSSIPVLNLKELEAMELDLLEKESVYI